MFKVIQACFVQQSTQMLYQEIRPLNFSQSEVEEVPLNLDQYLGSKDHFWNKECDQDCMAKAQDPLFNNNGGVPVNVHLDYLGDTAIEAAYLMQRHDHTTANWRNGHTIDEILRKLVLGEDVRKDIAAENRRRRLAGNK